MRKHIAIVTGAHSGLGREFVKLLCGEKAVEKIWAIARSEEKLAQLRRDLGSKIRPIPLDLTRRESFSALEQLLVAEKPSVLYLINNAGFAKFGAAEDVGLEQSLDMMDLNMEAVVAVGLLFQPYLRRGSHLLNIASQASFFPLPYMNLYSATKVFVRHYSRALGVELRPKGISVTAVCPGWMPTDLIPQGKTASQKGVTNFFGLVPPRAVAQKALQDAKKGRPLSVYGLYNKSSHLLSKVLPQRVLMRLWLIQQGHRS